MTITEPELAETEIDPQARKVNLPKLGAHDLFLLDVAGEEEGGDGDGSPAPRRESRLVCGAGVSVSVTSQNIITRLVCLAGTNRLPRLQAQDCAGTEGEADIQGGVGKLRRLTS